jgi:hypothetical protein
MSTISDLSDEEPPSTQLKKKQWSWRMWHERETPVYVNAHSTSKGITISLFAKGFLNTKLSIDYPNAVWSSYNKDNKIKLLDNVNYIFTAHLPLMLDRTVRMEYNTGFPHSFSYAYQCFMRYLPAYWHLYKKKRGKGVMPLLKTLLNSNYRFAETNDTPPAFPVTIDEQVIIPFTFGKDSFLTYHVAKELGLKPTLIWFNDPVDEGYEAVHKRKLFASFSKTIQDPIYFLDNPLGSLREKGDGWFGWELAISSWALLSLPFAYKKKAGYILFSNEKSTNAFSYDEEGMKLNPDWEQSALATEELSLLTQSLSEGEVYTSTFLQGLNDLAIIGILKDRYYDKTFSHLMSCWSEEEDEGAATKRWCGSCTKCARLYIYILANGIDPRKEAGFADNMLELKKKKLFNVFGKKAAGTGWDAFGLNTDEQALAFYIAYRRGNRDPLLVQFARSPFYKKVHKKFSILVEEYYGLHKEQTTPPQWKKKIDSLYEHSLNRIKKELYQLHRKPIINL